MRMLLGMVLGALLLAGVVFVADSRSTGIAATTGSASGTESNRPMVNWSVVGDNLRFLRDRSQDAWNRLSHKIAG